MKVPAEVELKQGQECAAGGDHAAAIQHLKRATELDGADARCWISLGASLIQLRHWAQAVAALRRGVDLRPHYAEADARLMLADALIGAGQHVAARAQLELVASMQPFYPSYDRPIIEARRRLSELAR